jgi:ATP-binding cassette subfamily B protein RaxB
MPSYLQSTATECAAACLGYIAAHHGRVYEMSELRAKFAVSMRGMDLGDLMQLSGTLGLRARPLRLELDEVPQLALPCILHWDMSHFVVLVRCSRGKLTIHDPAWGELCMTLKEASPHFTGVALELTPAPEFERNEPKTPISWRQLVGKLHGLKRSLGQLFVMAASLQVVLLVAPLFTQWIVDGAVVSGDVELLWLLVIGFGLVTLIKVGLEAARGWLSIVASVQFGTQWAARIMGHLMHLPAQWFELRHTGDVVSRFQSMQSIQQAVTGRLVEILLDGLFAVVTLLVMLLYSAKLAAVVIAGVLAYAAIRVLPHGAFHRASDEVLTHDAKAQTHFLESLRAIQTIKIAGLEDQRAARWTNIVVQATNRRTSTQKMTLAFGAGYSLVFGIESIAVLGLGAAMAIGGTLTVGMLMAFISYKDEFSSRMQRFVDNLMAIRMLRLHVERLSDIVLAEPEQLQGGVPRLASAEGFHPTITLDNVSFRYGSGAPWVLRHVQLEIRAGEHVAVVGATGCGKTTLAKIILGLLTPTEGTVRIDGVPLDRFGIGHWRRQIAAVMQDDQLFSASLQDNIAAFDETIDLARVQVSATLAAIDAEVTAMPMGYHTLNGDMGSSLSGGQKQRILLARALYRQPRVLVLDEATSHLDVGKERQVNEAIRALLITRITIAHRPETIAMADRVIDLTALPALPQIA